MSATDEWEDEKGQRMTDVIERDVAYAHGDTRMLGWFVAPAGAAGAPVVVLVHDAFGLGSALKSLARRYADLGYAVFAADVWGDRREPASGDDIGRLIGSMAADREDWLGRIGAAHVAAASQPEVAAERIASVGYCFGGASVIEYVRTGGISRGIASIHGGLDLVAQDWSAPTATARVLLCTGADDPMAAPRHWQPIKAGLTAAGIDWELDLYGGVQHGFTNPKSDDLPTPGVAYDPRAAARAWASTQRFLAEVLDE
ncbi:dienelactone hydrolase family protein [Microbacterium phosphatis]|uniref:dienelactone hydrolase family protein n=1 Tax=Microbacterium phosphatis TaxID=3140248 RepID=UPI0031403052